MELDRRSREYVYWPVTETPTGGTLDVSFDAGVSWHPLAVADGAAAALLAGPDATTNPVGTVVLPLGRSVVLVRAVADPERIHRYAGVVDVI